MKVVALVGSNAKFSYNRELLKFIQKHYTDNYEIKLAEIKNIPLFCEGLAEPDSVKNLANQILDSDMVIIATSENQHSVSSALKSVIEWLSSVEHPFLNKPVMVIGVSSQHTGSARAQVRLKNVLASPGVGAIVYNGNEFMLGNASEKFDEDGNLDSATVEFLDKFWHQFMDFYQTINGRKLDNQC